VTQLWLSRACLGRPEESLACVNTKTRRLKLPQGHFHFSRQGKWLCLEDIGAERLYRQNDFKPAIGGALKGAGAALAVTALDRGLQTVFGHNVCGHDLFAPTDIEAAAAGFAANSKGNYSLGIGMAVIGWIGGRVQNFYEK
jgi:hypothetical protein